MYPCFILNTSLLLILLLIGGLMSISLWCTHYNLEYLTLNKNHLVYSYLSFHNWSIIFRVFCTALLYFSTCNKYTSLEEQHVYSSFLNLIFVTFQEQIFMIHFCYCFPCSWISFPYWYLNNNRLMSFFIVCSAKI